MSAIPTVPERVAASVPVFLLLALVALLCLIVPKFEQMFREMDLGELPGVTMLLLLLINTLRNYWFLVLPALCWPVTMFFTWGCRSRRRMWWIVAFVMLAGGTLLTLAAFGLFMPLFVILERTGK